MHRVPPALLLLTLTWQAPALAAPPADPARLPELREKWTKIRAGYRRYAWQKPSAVQPKVSSPELRQLRTISRMQHISVEGDAIVGANDAYYEGARSGRPQAKARMAAIYLDRNGVPFSRAVRGGIAITKVPSETGEISETVRFRVPSRIPGSDAIDRPGYRLLGANPRGGLISARRLKQGGAYPGAQVAIRRTGHGFKAHEGISVASPGRIPLAHGDADSFTLLPPRLAPTERKVAPMLGELIARAANQLGLTPTEVHQAVLQAARKSVGFPSQLAPE